ncbi:MAG: DUF6470 family protein [Eubacteriales bacterium]
MDLRITQQFAQLSINYIQSQIEINSRPADMEINNPPVQIHIDYTEPLAEIGYQKIVPFEAANANRGQIAVLQGIARVAREGDSLARSAGTGWSIIGEIAWNKRFDQRDFNVDYVPHTPPEIWFTGGQPSINVQPHFPEMQVTPGKVQIYMEREPMIKFQTTGSYFDLVI